MKREKIGDAKAPEELVRDLVQAARMAFIPETMIKGREKWFYQQLGHFRKAVTHPAAILAQKGVRLPWDRYQEIVLMVIKEAARHAIGEIAWPGGYLRKCVQMHMSKHWEEYYTEGKAMGRAVETETGRLKGGGEAQIVEILSKVNEALGLRKPTRKKDSPRETQMGLF